MTRVHMIFKKKVIFIKLGKFEVPFLWHGKFGEKAYLAKVLDS